MVGADEDGNGVAFEGTLFGAAPPEVTVVDGTGTTPAGYLPLSLFSVALIGGAGDEIRVTSVPGTPGETHVITFTAKGKRRGEWQITQRSPSVDWTHAEVKCGCERRNKAEIGKEETIGQGSNPTGSGEALRAAGIVGTAHATIAS